MREFLFFEAAQVDFGAGDEDEGGLFDGFVAPGGPAFGGGLFVLIDAAIDALGAEEVG